MPIASWHLAKSWHQPSAWHGWQEVGIGPARHVATKIMRCEVSVRIFGAPEQTVDWNFVAALRRKLQDAAQSMDMQTGMEEEENHENGGGGHPSQSSSSSSSSSSQSGQGFSQLSLNSAQQVNCHFDRAGANWQWQCHWHCHCQLAR
jgi:hypothetical protein